jgi:hypothetical protein
MVLQNHGLLTASDSVEPTVFCLGKNEANLELGERAAAQAFLDSRAQTV